MTTESASPQETADHNRTVGSDAASPAPRLLSSLRGRRTYLLIYEAYRKATPKADLAQLLDVLIEDTQDAIASLSSQLRYLGVSPLQSGINEGLLAKGVRRRGTLSKMNFLLVGTSHNLEWYAEQAHDEDPSQVQALWQELAAMEQRHQDMIKAFLGGAELAHDRSSEPVHPPEGGASQD